MSQRCFWMVVFLMLSACAEGPQPQTPIPASCPVAQSVPAAQSGPVAVQQCPVCEQKPVAASSPVVSEPVASPFLPAVWSDLPGWTQDHLTQVWPAFLASCQAMRQPQIRAAWHAVCTVASGLGAQPTDEQIRSFMVQWLEPQRIVNADGSDSGLITGYYEPLIQGSRWHSRKSSVPVYGVPRDLLQLDFADLYPETKNMRLRGRVSGNKVVPYWTRAQIEDMGSAFPAPVLLWVNDPVEFFFLQVQGSGQVQLSDGSRVRLAYADQNGQPYRSIGRWLVQTGQLKLSQASMSGIQAWVRAHPRRLSELLNVNPSYVFFREEPASGEGPKGSLGLPLTAMRSIAVDTRVIPLGIPVFMDFAMPDGQPVQRLVMAQDTGGAIRGRVRADFFWGFGDEAGAQAGRMRQQGQMWMLWPKGARMPEVTD